MVTGGGGGGGAVGRSGEWLESKCSGKYALFSNMKRRELTCKHTNRYVGLCRIMIS